jgi:hypothetical protein
MGNEYVLGVGAGAGVAGDGDAAII